MTPAEAKKCVVMLLAAFPNTNASPGTPGVYEQGILDLDARLAWEAVQALIATCRFLPTVAEIRDEVRKRLRPDTAKPPELAWEVVMRAVRRLGIYRTPRFKDPHIDRAVKAIGWRTICNSEIRELNALRAQFRDAYRAAQMAAAREVALPPGLRSSSRPELTAGSSRDDEFSA